MSHTLYVWEDPNKQLAVSADAPLHLAKVGETVEVGVYQKVDVMFLDAPICVKFKLDKADEILRQAKGHWAAVTQGKRVEPSLELGCAHISAKP